MLAASELLSEGLRLPKVAVLDPFAGLEEKNFFSYRWTFGSGFACFFDGLGFNFDFDGF